MLIIDVKAESRLIAELESLRQQERPKRCLWIKADHIPPSLKSQHNIVNFCAKLHPYLEDPEAHAYVCEDGDIFILANRLSFKLFKAATDDISLWLNTAASAFMKLYDLSLQWQEVAVAAEAKMTRIIIREQQAASKEKETQRKAERQVNLDRVINQKDVESIAERRRERSRPAVLVVEDDRFSQQLVERVLQNDYEVQLADDGREAISQYVRHAPDILFLDINLPDVTGFEVMTKILAFDAEAFIVMLSGNGDRDNVIKAMKSGAKGFVGKPFTKQKLVEYIEKSPLMQRFIRKA